MAGRKSRKNLCTTCKSSSACTFKLGTAHQSFFCEEFESAVLVSKPAIKTISGAAAWVQSYGGESAAAAGLCGDCSGRHECSASRAEGGVWHCEEYR
ncbi:MAG: hypothetical protein QG656_1248 [Candidatus Hydrogenedentes bacterium]|nr:hypothetical protein [Candidatus Hydrogenedentota bacterium]